MRSGFQASGFFIFCRGKACDLNEVAIEGRKIRISDFFGHFLKGKISRIDKTNGLIDAQLRDKFLHGLTGILSEGFAKIASRKGTDPG